MPGTNYVRCHYQYCPFLACIGSRRNLPQQPLGKRWRVTFVENTALSHWPAGGLGPSQGESSGQSLGDGQICLHHESRSQPLGVSRQQPQTVTQSCCARATSALRATSVLFPEEIRRGGGGRAGASELLGPKLVNVSGTRTAVCLCMLFCRPVMSDSL